MRSALRIFLSVILVLLVCASHTIADETATPSPPEIIDVHCHVAGLGFGKSGNFISLALRNSYKFRYYLWAMGVSQDELSQKGDRYVVERLSAQVAESKRVSKAVVLAIDGRVDANGDLDRALTEFYVANEFVAEETAKYPNLLFGASINPYRKDALERLTWAKQHGAVLLKWLPSIMDIDPADPALTPFYQKMIELELPLLTHTGQERSFTHARDELCDPQRLHLPLQLGVTVIAAHVASTGENGGEEDFTRLLPLLEQYPNLYADISSLTQINKLGYLRRALDEPRFAGRLVYGSDWPLQYFPVVSPWYHFTELTLDEINEISALTNKWDQDVMLKEKLGVTPDIFARSAQILTGAQKNTPPAAELPTKNSSNSSSNPPNGR